MPTDEVELPPDHDVDEDMPDDDDEATSSEPVTAAVTQREKRVTAGNRMRALLEDEALEQEEMFKDEDGDEEFEAKGGADDQDVFDSDFGSTDSEAGADEDGEDAGERQLEREAKAARREAKGKKKKAHTPFLPNFARQTKHARKQQPIASTSATTLDGDATPLSDQPPPLKKRKVSLANTIASMTPRESSRKSAVAFKKSIEVRLLESEQRRVTAPKPVKKAAKTLTQADLIAEALETEEVNRASLLAFYAAEEDRRAADRILGMRYELYGPRLTFLSRAEGVERKDKGKARDLEEPVSKESDKMESGRRRLIEVIGEAGKVGWKPQVEPSLLAEGAAARGEAAPSTQATAPVEPSALNIPPDDALDPAPPPAPSSSQVVPDLLVPPAQPPDASAPPAASSSSDPPKDSDQVLLPAASTSTAAPPPPPPSSTDVDSSLAPTRSGTAAANAELAPAPEPHTRNFLILTDFEGTKSEEMGAVFGDHHEWGSVKVVPSRSRVLNRKVPTCALTGQPAPYRDPRTLTPYATIAAYKTLTSVVEQRYLWNETMGAFTTSLASTSRLRKEIDAAQAKHGAPPPPPVLPAAASTSTSSSSTGVTSAGGVGTGGNGSGKGKAKAIDQDNPYAIHHASGSEARAARRSRGSEVDAPPGTPTPTSGTPPTSLTSTGAPLPSKGAPRPKATARSSSKGKAASKPSASPRPVPPGKDSVLSNSIEVSSQPASQTVQGSPAVATSTAVSAPTPETAPQSSISKTPVTESSTPAAVQT